MWEQNNTSRTVLICEEKKEIVKSVRHEKNLLILTEIMLIKVWAKREVNNGSPMHPDKVRGTMHFRGTKKETERQPLIGCVPVSGTHFILHALGHNLYMFLLPPRHDSKKMKDSIKIT